MSEAKQLPVPGDVFQLTIGVSSSEIDLPDSVACLRYYAGLADKFFGQTIPHFGKDKFVYTIHQPIGVCGQM